MDTILQGGGLVQPTLDADDFYKPPAAAPDYAAMSDGDMLGEIGTDCYKWTDAFMQKACFDNPLGRALRLFPHTNDRKPHELANIMASWFANAIGAGITAGLAYEPTIDPQSDEGRSFKWRKKPVVIDAVCFLGVQDGMPHFNVPPGDALPDWLAEACAGPEDSPGSAWLDYEYLVTTADPMPERRTHVMIIGTLEGKHIVTPGDWVIRGVNGEIYPCKPPIFAKTYDAADKVEPPITRDEVLRRGCEEGDGIALDVIHKLGWPTEGEPLGRNPTHELVPLKQVDPA